MEDPFELTGKAKEDHEKWQRGMDARIGRTDGVVKENPFEKKTRSLHEQARDYNKGVAVVEEKKDSKVDHNKRAKEYFEKAGYDYERTEYYNAFARRKFDFLGVFDAVAFSPKNGIVGIQITTFDNRLARKKKMLESKRCERWVISGGKAVILSYKLVGRHYQPELIPITKDDFKLVKRI